MANELSSTPLANNPFLNPPFDPLQTRPRSNAVLCPNCNFMPDGSLAQQHVNGHTFEHIIELDNHQAVIVEVAVRIFAHPKKDSNG